MPSSISSSKLAAPQANLPQDTLPKGSLPDLAYGRVWLLAGMLFVLLFLSAELYLRGHGFEPSITDSMPLWAQQRAQVYRGNDGRETIVVIGSSRSQLGVVPEVLEQKLPNYRAVHLSINGTTPYALFADLAKDPDFTGIILLDALTQEMVAFEQQPWVDFYHQQWTPLRRLNQDVNTRIQVLLQARVNLLASQFTVHDLLWNRYITPAYVVTRPNRYRKAYYYERLTAQTLATLAKARIQNAQSAAQYGRHASSVEFAQLLEAQFRPLTQQLQERGGQVIFIQMPVSGEVEAIADATYPLPLYWNQIPEHVGAPAIHYRQLEQGEPFICPDGSHLDGKDALRFTANLADELVRQGIVQSAP